MNSDRPNKYLIGALLISLLVHAALLICLVYWGHLKLKPSDTSRLNIEFASAAQEPKQVVAELPQTPTPTFIKPQKPPSDPNVDPSENSSGWGMQRDKKRNMAIDQKSQIESRIGFEKMQRQGNVNLSIANIMNTLQQQGIQVSCDLRLNEDFSAARITCQPQAIEGYIQSLLGPANLRWENNDATKPVCISIQSLGGTRKTCL